MAAEAVPRVRMVGLPDDAVFVVRGGDLDAHFLRSDATRFRRRFGEWGRFGVSAFLAVAEDEVLILCETRLANFATVVVFRRTDLAASGIEIVPTFRRPHVTLAHVALDSLVNGISACEHGRLENPHYAGGGARP